MMNPHEEIIQIVDSNNIEIAAVLRRIMRVQNLIHRASYILVLNRSDELFIQKRSMTKDIYPGYWDVAAGGVVLAGEDYEESAKRELKEELGITDIPLEYCFDHYFEDESNRVWGRIFRCLANGPFVLQADEVEYGMFVSVEAALNMSIQDPFTPDGIQILRRFQDGGDN